MGRCTKNLCLDIKCAIGYWALHTAFLGTTMLQKGKVQAGGAGCALHVGV